MTKLSFSDIEFGAKRRQIRRDKFMAEMNELVPWARLVALSDPFYPQDKGGSLQANSC
jgi:IS5 family transposase